MSLREKKYFLESPLITKPIPIAIETMSLCVEYHFQELPQQV